MMRSDDSPPPTASLSRQLARHLTSSSGVSASSDKTSHLHMLSRLSAAVNGRDLVFRGCLGFITSGCTDI